MFLSLAGIQPERPGLFSDHRPTRAYSICIYLYIYQIFISVVTQTSFLSTGIQLEGPGRFSDSCSTTRNAHKRTLYAYTYICINIYFVSGNEVLFFVFAGIQPERPSLFSDSRFIS